LQVGLLSGAPLGFPPNVSSFFIRQGKPFSFFLHVLYIKEEEEDCPLLCFRKLLFYLI
jgi:hypothetical protein